MDDTSCHDLVALLVAVAAINETAWLFPFFRWHFLKASRILKLCSVLFSYSKESWFSTILWFYGWF